MFSLTAEYALRATVCLAQSHGSSQTTQDIAAATQAPVGYLPKVMQHLGKAGLVLAWRGKHGGFRLARDPAKITVLDVLNAVDPLRRIKTCPLGISSHSCNLCPLHQKMDAAMAVVEEGFGQVSLAELLTGTQMPLCETAQEGLNGAVQ
ncbi:MAG: Rrf2 family transcriptional regulator [Acidobacteriia bacterium]|nr:Rrf2 family transcriptional regulator [Terriglobia bacterium]